MDLVVKIPFKIKGTECKKVIYKKEGRFVIELQDLDYNIPLMYGEGNTELEAVLCLLDKLKLIKII